MKTRIQVFRLADGSGIRIEVWLLLTTEAVRIDDKTYTWGQLIQAIVEPPLLQEQKPSPQELP